MVLICTKTVPAMTSVPEGFHLTREFDPITAACAPTYLRDAGAEGLWLGFEVTASHCNPRGHCHGGVWATLADVLLGLTVGLKSGLGGPTINLTLDFLGAAAEGQWVEGRARLLRQTPRMGFAECLFTADGEPALRASGIFRRKDPGGTFDEMIVGP